uniref:GNAT family N-acetyltransferase n=1 Tax=Candidatus Enterococcus willemsii TaxID=1857215 RepID=UPI00403F7612
MFEQLSQENAEIIANQWKYEGEYSFYNLTEDPEDYEEMLSPTLRANHYFQYVREGELVGYFVLEEDGEVLLFGLGLAPELTGNGHGSQFLQNILSYIQENYSQHIIRLGVAEFNVRAQKVYQKAGFIETRHYLQETNGGQFPFIEMEKNI